MKEVFLHYLWRYQKFNFSNLVTTSGDSLTVVSVGQTNSGAGPDFSLAQIQIGNVRFAGSVEIHLRSSQWYHHRHHQDSAYDNVILHVVWEKDTPLQLSSGKSLPTLELRHYVTPELVAVYRKHFSEKTETLPCANVVRSFPNSLWKHWRERLYIERLEMRLGSLEKRLAVLQHDWEALLFERMARGFGLNRNGAAFQKLAESIPFSLVRKLAPQLEDLEALFFGQMGLLPEISLGDTYATRLKERYQYLSHKHNLRPLEGVRPNFGRLRPQNFPTIRLAQLVNLYHQTPSLFMALHQQTDLKSLPPLVITGISDYWKHRFHLESSKPLPKPQLRKLSTGFRSLVFINTLLPVFYAHSKWTGEDRSEWLFEQLEAQALESNRWVKKYAAMGFPLHSALDSQAFLQLQEHYCEGRHCLKCTIGFHILKQSQ